MKIGMGLQFFIKMFDITVLEKSILQFSGYFIHAG
jgi:hypothetical protein